VRDPKLILSILGIYPRRGIEIVKHEKHVITYKYKELPPFRVTTVHPLILVGSSYLIFSFMCIFFVDRCLSFWPLFCLFFFDLRFRLPLCYLQALLDCIISVISWQSVLLVDETVVPGENHRPVASHWQTLSHNVVLRTPRHQRDSNTHNFSGDRHWLHMWL
jgi:hypothetical protein